MIKPLYDRVLLEKMEAKAETASGIILPESGKEEPSTARVVAVGEGRKTDDNKLIPVDVAVGDIVIYKKYSTTEVKHHGKEYLIIDMKDILAVVEEN